VSETPFDFAVQLGSGLAFVLLWRLSPGRWSRIGRRAFYYGPLLNSVLGVVPLVIVALWLMFGVLVPLAVGRFGDYPSGSAETEWLALVLWPLGLTAVVFFIGRPLWLQPPGRWHVLSPTFGAARWWPWVLPSLVGGALLLSAVIGASTSAGVPEGAAVVTFLVLAAGFLIPAGAGRVTAAPSHREPITTERYVCSGFATSATYSARTPDWTPSSEFANRAAARLAARHWLESQGSEAEVELVRLREGEGTVEEVITQSGAEPIVADDAGSTGSVAE
jgi:hypothetical protein